MVPAMLEKEILPLVAPALAAAIRRTAPHLRTPLEEIRLREERPLELVCSGEWSYISTSGGLTSDPGEALCPGREEMCRTFQLLAQGSVYAWEEEIRNGFLTIRGGHRVGVCGRVVVEDGRLKTIRQVASLNIRIAREVPGCASGLLPRLIRDGKLLSTLCIAPPQAGKTTVLRDLVRLASQGVPSLGFAGVKVGVVDERSEIGGCFGGVPQRDLGPRTDILDACPKAEGIMLLVRSMSPQVLAVDEVGRPEDGTALMEALHAGVSVLATAHGSSVADVTRRPALRSLLESGAFDRAVILSRSRGPGTVERVLALEGGAVRAG